MQTLIAATRGMHCARRVLRVASSTGYTREMMRHVLDRAAAQGYVPDHLVCSGETPPGRPSPLMIHEACAELGVAAAGNALYAAGAALVPALERHAD